MHLAILLLFFFIDMYTYVSTKSVLDQPNLSILYPYQNITNCDPLPNPTLLNHLQQIISIVWLINVLIYLLWMFLYYLVSLAKNVRFLQWFIRLCWRVKILYRNMLIFTYRLMKTENKSSDNILLIRIKTFNDANANDQ